MIRVAAIDSLNRRNDLSAETTTVHNIIRFSTRRIINYAAIVWR